MNGFKGVPIPAAGLLIASFPLIWFYSNNASIQSLFLYPWFWYGVILVVSYLMISTMPMLALKFKSASVQAFLPFLIIAVIAVAGGFLFGWLAVPLSFIAYVILSLLFKPKNIA